jgi:hypothetical protein
LRCVDRVTSWVSRHARSRAAASFVVESRGDLLCVWFANEWRATTRAPRVQLESTAVRV